MKRIIILEQTVKFQHEVEIEVEDSFTLRNVNGMLNHGFSCLDAACYALDRIDGTRVVRIYEDSDGESNGVDCIDIKKGRETGECSELEGMERW